MKKLLAHFLLITTTLVGAGFFFVPTYVEAQITTQNYSQMGGQNGKSLNVQNEERKEMAGKSTSCNILSLQSLATDCLFGLLGKIFWALGYLAGWAVWLMGQMIDIATTMGMTKEFYNSDAIKIGWMIIRDIANMLFIFVLIYAGMATILNLGNGHHKKTLIKNVIIAALLINFSLFITQAIIDVSNIATAWFVQGVQSIGNGEGLSDSVRSILQMEKLVENKDFGVKAMNMQSFVAGLAFLVINLVAVYVFFQVAFFLIARIVAFMFLLITAPLGFLGALDVPQLKTYAAQWWKELQANALMAPMFFLMLYLTLLIVDRVNVFMFSGATKTDPVSGSSFGPENYVMFMIIIIMLLRSLSVAKEYSGKFAAEIAGYAKSATSIAFGAVAGTGALIGRTGAAAYFAGRDAKPGEGRKDAKLAAYKTFRSAMPIWNSTTPLSDTIKKAAKEGSWDIRNTAGFDKFDKNSNKIGDLLKTDLTARSAKEHKEEKENFEKEYKLQTDTEAILKEIRDIEKARADVSAGRITQAQFDAAVNTSHSNIKSKTSKLSSKDLEVVTSRVHNEAKSIAKNNTDRVNGLTTADVFQSYTDQLKQNQVSTLASSEIPGTLKSSLSSARTNSLDEIFDNRLGVAPRVWPNPAARVQAIRNALFKLSNVEVSKLDTNLLNKPEVANILKIDHLKKIMEELTLSERASIRNEILTNGAQKTKDWLNNDAVGQSF